MSSYSPEMANVFSVVVRQSLFNQEVLNKYYFIITNVETLLGNPLLLTWQNFWDVFKVQVMRPAILDQMVFSHLKLEVLDQKYTVLDVAQPPEFVDGYAQSGDVTSGDCMPSFVTFSSRLQRPYAGIRHGGKRLAGVPEVYADDGVCVVNPTHWANYANHVNDPAQVSVGPVGGNEADYAVEQVYRARTAPNSYAWVHPVSMLFPVISTQNTRKIGRGS